MLSFAIVIHSLKPAITPLPNQMWLRSHRLAVWVSREQATTWVQSLSSIQTRGVCLCAPLELSFFVLVNEMDLFSDVMIGCWSEPMGHYLSLSDAVELCVCADAQLRFSTATICIALKREKIIISLTLASLSSPFLRAQVYLLVLRALWFTRSDENVLFCVSVRNSLQPSSVFCNSSRLFTPFRKMWRGFSELWESSLSFTYLGQMSWVRSWLVVVARASLRDSRQNFNGLAPSLLGPMRG